MKLNLGVMDVPYSRSYLPATSRTPPALGNMMSTGDVALILEARYGVMAMFYLLHGQDIADALGDVMEAKLEALMMGAPVDPNGPMFNEGDLGEVEALFRAFLDNREMDGRAPGVPTQAARAGVSHRFLHPYARREERPSFIDTGAYQTNFRAWVEE